MALRASRIIANLRVGDNSDPELADRLAAHVHDCPEHGRIADPVIGLTDAGVIFACPWCSGSAVREAWEAEVDDG